MTLAVIGWPDVLLALILAPPAYVAAYNTLRVRQQVETTNGKTLAATLEQAHSSAAKTETIVKRRLGERHNDAPVEKRPRVSGERDGDSATGE